MLSRVDLPQPEWPMIETNSPFSMLQLMSREHSVVWPPRGTDVDMVDFEIGHGWSPRGQVRWRPCRG
jgi:hypothetical protein